MKKTLLILTAAAFIACHSKSNKTEETKTSTDTTTTIPPPPKNDTGYEDPARHSKIDIETFGDIKLGMTYKELAAAIGQPGKKGDATEWGADGLFHQDWTYPALGLVVNVSFEKDQLLQTGKLFSITATAPNTYSTRAGMHIGSSYTEVQTAYSKDIDPEATDKTHITVGSVYGGIMFSFKDDKAEKIFLGAEAE